ncbi:hypothetical protein [Nostoc sp. PA-18-2419]|uniref:hypothetical protein n=1 Tax=Nostoc sp. PA-18-2419 TaxID=2575443 RepID=UPI001108DE3A|nr:hypothetical protein [Nostoc sp. PA-18-2419]
MKVDTNNIFTVVCLVFMLVTGIYRLAQIEVNINARISNVQANLLIAVYSLKDNFADRLYINEKN